MSFWMRVLAQAALVFSNLAALPSFFLCMRLALRHVSIRGNLRKCAVCTKGRSQQQTQGGLLGLWEKHSCFILHTARALAYLNVCEPGTSAPLGQTNGATSNLVGL